MNQPIAEGRHAWLQVLRGDVTLNDVHSLSQGDGAAVSGESTLALRPQATRNYSCSISRERFTVPFFSRMFRHERINEHASRRFRNHGRRRPVLPMHDLSDERPLGNKIPNFNGVADLMGKAGVPAPKFMLVGAIVFLLVGGFSVLVGYKAKVGTALLLVFLVLATYYFHAFWKATDPQAQMEQMSHFMKNLAAHGIDALDHRQRRRSVQFRRQIASWASDPAIALDRSWISLRPAFDLTSLPRRKSKPKAG